MSGSLSFLCITTSFKGNDFLKTCKEAGNTVYLLTSIKLKDKPWPLDYIDNFFFIEEDSEGEYDLKDMVTTISLAMRSHTIDRIVALNDLDVEKAALLREEFRIPGMGQTTARYFRDKLAMRTKAKEAGIRVPVFSGIFNDTEIHDFTTNHPGPWMIKPRSEDWSVGIVKAHTVDELWDAIGELGDKRHEYLIEQFKPGNVFHVDSLSMNGRVIFTWSSQYLAPPFEVAQGSGVFRSVTVPFDTAESRALETITVDVLKAFGMEHSASNTEVIRCSDDGLYYFLETSSSVGGGQLADLVEAASGVNLWKEWAKLETAVAKNDSYKLPFVRKEYSGIIMSRTLQHMPDETPFNAQEITWKVKDDFKLGYVLRSKNRERIIELLDEYTELIKSHLVN